MNLKVLTALLVPALALGAQDFRGWVRGLEARGIAVSAGIWDAETGKALDRHRETQALVPASTTKAVTTYALLKTLKPDSTIETEVWGDLKDGVVQGDLTFKGDGDPLFTSERIWLLAQSLKKQGIRRVAGGIRLDQSAFDAQREPPGWENTSADTLPEVRALSVNFNRDENGRLAADADRLARETIQKILQETGIAVEGRANLLDAPRKLASWTSPPLRALVLDINKWSNNFMIEMLVRRFGAGSWPRGVQRIQAFYRTAFNLGPEAIQITDGSGLSKDNRLSARTLATILRGAYYDFEVGPEFVASLKIIGGEPWKLKVKDANLTRRVRVKTGHLDRVTSLCGYLQTLDGQVRVFAILLNGPARDEDVWEQVSRWAN
ncbi:D-alanyl-D-alanine carboxypeptidase/D-alanyl-D-alanine-endopeptidase [Geothrix oryzae]|uniref:D-alanyl-D-alanine carboxypeptidase/D-alanyl-D-alanine-endopeptidase n=1 Tax=Geothrix oryzae TaxID=2927975 RepID=A0ABN6UY45_9BACT|nr:D-alanyl-D-alanine carboxypeptidase [Geothrix oryzae]BDU69901.1 D-alanyl-D-alanine carboxypeptidase/D-alanyl-D-alanine-endopeptidase [Geothrix oryzae]